ncbi:uncharacterized protein LOC132787654 [Drosophila nasuta]|uniref:uncharacterized protein LOC132787654 n=1 Tax=Drosophila nasuta TaxID=42062 RepID=UPI00295E26B3|nr:uncharacterized protein LOC132787654 [Drosophila nasuta]
MRAKATSLAVSCCRLTFPSLDKGYAECRKSLNLPKNRRFTFVEQYAINTCVEECNYISSGYTEIDPPFHLDIGNVRLNLENTMPSPQAISVPFLVDAFTKCSVFRAQHGKLFKMQLPDIEFITDDCNSFALDVTICVRIHAMQKCPKEFYKHDSSDCQMAKEYFTHCVDDIEANISY